MAPKREHEHEDDGENDPGLFNTCWQLADNGIKGAGLDRYDDEGANRKYQQEDGYSAEHGLFALGAKLALSAVTSTSVS
jgi:hypothetical protein